MLIKLYRENFYGINFIRYLLAIAVIFGHSYKMGGFGEEPLIFSVGENTPVGQIAVGVFFTISGFLITNSAIKSNFSEFLLKRFLRIYPAYFVVLILTAIVVGPIINLADNRDLIDYFISKQNNSPIFYVLRNMLMPLTLQEELSNVFLNNPVSLNLNGSLWTLPLEIRAYFVCFVLVTLGLRLNNHFPSIVFFLFLSIFIIFKVNNVEEINYLVPNFISYYEWSYWLFNFFFASLVALYFKKDITKKTIIIAVSIFIAAALLGGIFFKTVGVSMSVFLVPVIAKYLKFNKIKFFKNDILYGTYIYGYLIGQIIIYFLPKYFSSHFVYFLCTCIFTTFIALLSWYLVEKPSLSYKLK